MGREANPFADKDVPDSFVLEENVVLLERLAGLESDPHGTLIALQESMEIDIASQPGLDFRGWRFIKDPESFRAETLSPGQYEAIKSFEEVSTALLRYGSLAPRQLGVWLTVPNRNLDNWTPIHRLFFKIGESGRFNKNTVRNVVRAATPFLTPEHGGEYALKSLWAD